MQAIEQATFDYSGLSSDKAKFVRAVTTEIRERMGKAAQNVFEIGSMLLEVKERLDHGQFGEWLTVEFAWTVRTAQNMMNVAKRFKSETVSHLDIAPSALYLLASDSVPEEVRDEIIDRATSGERVTKEEVKKAVSKTISKTHYRESDGEVIDDILVETVKVTPVRNKQADANDDADDVGIGTRFNTTNKTRGGSVVALRTRIDGDDLDELRGLLGKLKELTDVPSMQLSPISIRQTLSKIIDLVGC